MMRRALMTLVMGCGLMACTPKPLSPPTPTALENNETRMWGVLASQWPNQPQQLTELVTASVAGGEQTYVMRVDTEITATGLTMVALSPIGMPLYEMTVRDGHITVKNKAGPNVTLPATQILADFILVHWPADSLQLTLQQNGLSLRQSLDKRALYGADGGLLVEVYYEKTAAGKNHVRIKHNDVPLDLSIDTIMSESLPL